MSTPSLFNDESGESQDTQPALRVCVLGSGSGGNSAVVCYGDEAILIDAGFGPVTTAKRLSRVGLNLGCIKAIVLTHLDQDHFRPTWARTLLGWEIPVYCHEWHQEEMVVHPAAPKLMQAGQVRNFMNSAFDMGTSLSLTAVALKHDKEGTFAFHITAPDGGRLGYATDLGHVPDELIEHFAGVDLLAIESNYDPPMQVASNRPQFLQRRIMGRAGHLSNEQAFDCVRRIDQLSGKGNPQDVLLLHRSQQCNHPRMVQEVFEQSPDIWKRVTLTEQSTCSGWFNIKPQKTMGKVQMKFGF
jgi:phosphoribosyl 1,2-cyclic phosphodiesterase